MSKIPLSEVGIGKTYWSAEGNEWTRLTGRVEPYSSWPPNDYNLTVSRTVSGAEYRTSYPHLEMVYAQPPTSEQIESHRQAIRDKQWGPLADMGRFLDSLTWRKP